jgi:hypothetical protein
VFGKAKEDVAPEAEEEKQQSVPEEAKAEPKPEKPKQAYEETRLHSS